ncbi:hypothetical protein Goshw_026862 [Gossypium schwendimanii]|uniref:Uncharacterized protein n=1 Tax=Gossypium schwendimanii TaxID=34291 RepID=A0A7J9N6Q5_GOSSC|nr:hypothetical protein [Gossypium schwendimanii]
MCFDCVWNFNSIKMAQRLFWNFRF